MRTSCRHSLLERIMQASNTSSLFMGWCHLLKAVLVGGVGVSVSHVIYALSLEGNTSIYIDLTILTFSENIVQEAGIEWDGLRLVIRYWSNR